MEERKVSAEQVEALGSVLGLHLGEERARELSRQLQAMLRGVEGLEELGVETAEPDVTFEPRG